MMNANNIYIIREWMQHSFKNSQSLGYYYYLMKGIILKVYIYKYYVWIEICIIN
jgi:hypothetical protein